MHSLNNLLKTFLYEFDSKILQENKKNVKLATNTPRHIQSYTNWYTARHTVLYKLVPHHQYSTLSPRAGVREFLFLPPPPK